MSSLRMSYCSGNPRLTPLGCLSVLDTNHDFGKHLSTNRYYRAFLSNHRKQHRPSPEDTAEKEFDMKLTDVYKFESVNVNDLFGKNNFCLTIDNINDEAFKSFLGSLIYQNEEPNRIDMITDTTNLSQNTLCSLSVGNTTGRTIVSEATYFDRGRFQQIDGKCVVQQSIPVILNKTDQNLFALDYIRTTAFSTGERRYGTIEYENGEYNMNVRMPIANYIAGTPGKLPYYIRIVKNLSLGSIDKPKNILRKLLKDLENLYGIKPLSEQLLVDTLFDLKRSGDQLQVKTASSTKTLFATNDRISATYAKYLGLPTIRTSLEEQDAVHRKRKYYFYNFIGDKDTYISRVSQSMIDKITSILDSIEGVVNLSHQIQEVLFTSRSLYNNEDVKNTILSFLSSIHVLRNLNANIIGRYTSQRISFNENYTEIYKCLKVWEAGEYIANIIYFLLTPKVRDERYPQEVYSVYYSELLVRLKEEFSQLKALPTTTLTDYKHFLQKISIYDYGRFINLESQSLLGYILNSIEILTTIKDYRLFSNFEDEMDKDYLKGIEALTMALVSNGVGLFVGLREYNDFFENFVGVPITVQLFGTGISYTDYPTEFAKPVMVTKYKMVLEKIQSIEDIYKSMIQTFSSLQSGGKLHTVSKKIVKVEKTISKKFVKVGKPISKNSLWLHYKRQMSYVNKYESFYNENYFTNNFLSKLRRLYTPEEPLDEMAELIFVFLIKMSLEHDRYSYYDTDLLLSKTSPSSSIQSSSSPAPRKSTKDTPPAPRKSTKRTPIRKSTINSL